VLAAFAEDRNGSGGGNVQQQVNPGDVETREWLDEELPTSGLAVIDLPAKTDASWPALALCLPEESPARHGWDHIITIITAIHRGGATHPPADLAETLQPLKARCASPPTEGARQVAPS
jgi:hypothetical protein